MKCEEVREKLSAFIDDELSRNESDAVGSHLKACSSCLHEAEELRAIGAALRGLPRMKAPPSVAQAVAERISAERAAKNVIPLRRSTGRLEWCIAAAALVLIAINIAYLATLRPEDLGKDEGSPEIAPAKTSRSADKSVAVKAMPKNEERNLEKNAVSRQSKSEPPIASKGAAEADTGRAKDGERSLQVAKGEGGAREYLKGGKTDGEDDSKRKLNDTPPLAAAAPPKPGESPANRSQGNAPLEAGRDRGAYPTAVTLTIRSADLPAAATALTGVIEKLNLVADRRERKDADSALKMGKMAAKEKSPSQDVAPTEIVLRCTDDQLALLTSDLSTLSSRGGFSYSLNGEMTPRDEAPADALRKKELAEESADKVQEKQEDSGLGGEKRFAEREAAKPSAEPPSAAPGAQGAGGGRQPSLDRESKEEEKAGIYKQKAFGAGGEGGGEAEGKKASPLRTVIIRLIESKPSGVPEK